MTELTKCAACGDEFHMSGNAIGERIKLQYCTDCFRQWQRRGSYSEKTGEHHYSDRTSRRTPYDSRLPERGSQD